MTSPWLQLLRSLVSTPTRPGRAGNGAKPMPPRWRPSVEVLENRLVPSAISAITSSFNGTGIPAGDFLWFSSVAKVQGVQSSPVAVHVTDQTITFTANATPYTLSVPDTNLTLTPGATSATTSFDTGSNAWDTSVPATFSGNVFLAGVSFQAVGGLPGGIKNVTWQGTFTTDTPGIKVNWQWAAAVYSRFTTDATALGVKPVDDNRLSQYQNSDHAGTPELFKSFVLGGARGGGGSNFTGSYSATASVTPTVETPPPPPPPPPSPPGSLSGSVYFDANSDGAFDAGDLGLAGVEIDLQYTDAQGNRVSLATTTDANGAYSFTNLQPGTYSIVEMPPGSPYLDGVDTLGSLGGIVGSDLFSQIYLQPGANGTNYNFGEVLPQGIS